MSQSSNSMKCLAIIFSRHVQPSRFALNVLDLFISFKHINIMNQRNSWLCQAIQNCYLLGHVEPYLLLIGGSTVHLQTIKLSWNRGQLKSPFGFSISSVSDVGTWFLESSQFNAMRLEEVICQLIWQITQSEPSCSLERLIKSLDNVYYGRRLRKPALEEIHTSLSALTQAGAIYFSGRGYNLLTPEKLAVAKWLESVPEVCPDADSTLDTPNVKKAPLAETEILGSNAASSTQRSNLIRDKYQFQANNRHKLENTEKRTSSSALIPVVENFEQNNFSKSFTTHSLSPYQHQNNCVNQYHRIASVSPLTNCVKSNSNSQFSFTHKTVGINSDTTQRFINSARDIYTSKRNTVDVTGFSQPQRHEPELEFLHTINQSENLSTKFSKFIKSPLFKKSQSPSIFKWLLDRFHQIRLFSRHNHTSVSNDKVVQSYADMKFTGPTNQQRPYDNNVPVNRQTYNQEVSPSNLRRCFSLSDGGKTNKPNQTVKHCGQGMESQSFTEIGKECDTRGYVRQSSYSSKDLHCISQRDLCGSPDYYSAVSPLSRNYFSSQSHLGSKSVPRLLTSSPALVNNSKVSLQASVTTSVRDNDFAKERQQPHYVFGNIAQSCFLIPSNGQQNDNILTSDYSHKTPPSSSTLWWYTGSNRLTPFSKVPTSLFFNPTVRVSSY
ncbi:unnamed protein product [Trichobilharzia szidati]|nr:unnamed protein product [Trichobilharzia szidati]